MKRHAEDNPSRPVQADTALNDAPGSVTLAAVMSRLEYFCCKGLPLEARTAP